ncbi:Uncharacterized conserved protein [Burkholderia pseudomallei]|uniref:type I restriction endonuclease n=1 Tax=Burkholderia pseudomallei TaxID=28450 RepID=UPI000F1EA281|nr:type I restriction enzyme HsdR N-terminal domain-containing protein [Burkholderia pseudomallei]MCD4547544.1 type I restriction enzyme HsdR N-terminal domain-containing protein [Burkholderia pseudomallei]CAJ2974143.1 Uncharacterized conserved protein [Burkholderia pseudomallei]CAJ3219444.1 Uncharacterized conserved protein [Burkholderia pseudomallei]CAJ3237407.1 Uncharacterized conserved protein [Burkholderia pseudomallei]CAJ4027472.1 Uncharacterized conserved protein [Burkholderia pseudomal
MIEKLLVLAKKVKTSAGNLQTEEATKNALVMPFLSTILGYDVFDPSEVVPEFTADVGIKKGEKVDYAIIRDSKIQMLVECKRYGDALSVNHASQLYRYFSVTEARIAVLTNGSRYQFFTDLDASNKMDDKPFLDLDLENIDENIIPELQKLTKAEFDVETITNSAGELKYLQQIKKIVGQQFVEPDDEFVKLFIFRVYDGKATQRVVEQFKKLALVAFGQFISDKVNERLKSAIEKPDQALVASDVEGPSVSKSAEVEAEPHTAVASEVEIQAYNIVRAILCQSVEAKRVFYRVNNSGVPILLDDTNRKPICRLYLKKDAKFIGLIDGKKEETKLPLASVEDIFQHAPMLLATVKQYEQGAQ